MNSFTFAKDIFSMDKFAYINTPTKMQRINL